MGKGSNCSHCNRPNFQQNKIQRKWEKYHEYIIPIRQIFSDYSFHATWFSWLFLFSVNSITSCVFTFHYNVHVFSVFRNAWYKTSWFFFYSIVEIAMGFIFFLNNFFYSIVKTSMDHIPWRFSMLTHNSYCFYDFVQYVCNAIKIQETPSLLHCQATSRLPGRS